MLRTQREIFADNLQALLNSRDVSQKVLAEHLGVSETSVSYWSRGEKYPRIDKIQKIADYFNITMRDLMDDKRKVNTLDRPTNLIEISPATIKIPILGKIACGDPITAEENLLGYRYESPDNLPSGKLIYLQAKGDSMEPTIPNGSYVLIREQPEVENGEIAAVLVNGDTEATLKRVKRQGETVFLMPDNPKHEPYVISPDNPARIIGKAIRFTQDL
ncbi:MULTISPECIES: LexA family transcriptional regulator [Lysinibacillus]|uniref:LexA family protein n=1 Tax=Lysinibacillus TaxID=400634 RepID=UPI00214A95D6|nr:MULTISPECIES: XRE family transcriptional regulator [Lysinibacillus]UUV27565.1 XRE family transcriptional regulator [Lysinibacillus sp. FN11]UYB49910.1 XRE family transcriptional regulator [Lysinibacillus capsici]WGT41781.1 XRE family transcriptional regulator [Lysinibacillus sp. 1 U-2021]